MFDPIGLEEPLPEINILIYTVPQLTITLNENNKVIAMQLGHTENVYVEGHDFLRFKYLSLEELERLGRPTAKFRQERIKEKMLERAPKGTDIDYFTYRYNRPQIELGLVFDSTKRKDSENFIALDYIFIGGSD